MTVPAAERLVVDLKTAAELLSISEGKLREEMYAGRIAPQRIGSKVMFHRTELERYASDLPSWEPR